MNDLLVDPNAIEKQLTALWRAEKQDGEKAVTKAALWNVVAHTWTSLHHAHATETLARASAAVPQRTIVVHADPDADHGIRSWISANCHILGARRQVCSEEVSIVASGSHVHHVPPLVSALLLPDMPVAVWWVGDLPRDHHRYAETLLEPADRLIFDSSHFDASDDLQFIARIAEETTTAPADLTWARIEEWRGATAALFDPASMRERLQQIRLVRVVSGGDGSFGTRSEALLYVSWLTAQVGREVGFDFAEDGVEPGIRAVEIEFDDRSTAALRGDSTRGVVISSVDGSDACVDCVTRGLARSENELIVRLLKRPEADPVFLKSLRIACEVTR
jgi:glucose-6-phosphate dehydrogenase assembly protein OpcA